MTGTCRIDLPVVVPGAADRIGVVLSATPTLWSQPAGLRGYSVARPDVFAATASRAQGMQDRPYRVSAAMSKAPCTLAAVIKGSSAGSPGA